ncbi:SpoIIE family protein phosphatase [Streptomyces yangpuensis]|uniref:SpoIIE family protein phosphatase n=1 Tax=Streptomyces yangpuensis TaxID=1648182 RepID=A0ABY5PPU2_9ACTN|nr:MULTISPECIES: SpoIIE family protein phosphatase [Streptomyces]MBZ9593963.1 SpoIIE family protein phosphatase [Streptomyces erythrochromogenes]UUY46005.1 SpoIIE family protein phosphatase [Streptomyces yangpuensis]
MSGETTRNGAVHPPSAPAAGQNACAIPQQSPTPLGRLVATVERLRREVLEAQAAADGRALVELAKGILIGQLNCTPAAAARQLDVLCGESGTSRLELAADIVNQASRDQVSEIAAAFVEGAGAGTRTGRDAGPAGQATVSVRLRTAESGMLAAASDTQAVAESLLTNALGPLGAVAVAVWTAVPDGSLALAGHAGFPPGEALRWRHVPPGVSTVAGLALRERRLVTLSRLGRAGLPSIGHLQWPEGGRMAVPTGTGGRIHGVLEICWPQPLAPQPPQIERQVEALAELCARTMDAAPPGDPTTADAVLPDVAELIDLAEGLQDPAVVLTPVLDPEGRLTDFRIRYAGSRFVDPVGRPRGDVNGALLLEAYPMAAAENGLFDIIERVHATGEPFRAERMSLTALVDQIPLTSVADISVSRHGAAVLLIWRIEDETARLANLLQHAQRLGRIGGFEENLATGETTWNAQLYALHGLPATAPPVRLRELPGHAHPDDSAALGRFLRALLRHRRPSSVSFRLQRPDGITRHIRVVAEPVLDADQRLHAVRGAYQDISAQHWTEVALAATRDQLAHTEAESAERNRLALQLQHAIMPVTPQAVEAPGMRVAVRYRPAETESLVGGDWYDTVVLPSGLIMLSVGDVAGHGIEAATGMVVLRNALRGLAVTGAGPGQLLSWLNTVTHNLAKHVTATAVCGIYDPCTRVLRWARAGHLPPVLVRGGGAEAFPLIEGLLLGALPDVVYGEREVRLEPDDTLLMFTDGLVERRDSSVQDSLGHLVNAAAAGAGDLDARLDRLLAGSRSDTDDDTCVIGIQVG